MVVKYQSHGMVFNLNVTVGNLSNQPQRPSRQWQKTPEINVVKVHLINNFVLTERQDRQLILARVSRYAARPKVKP